MIAKHEKLRKYLPYCTTNSAITSTYRINCSYFLETRLLVDTETEQKFLKIGSGIVILST